MFYFNFIMKRAALFNRLLLKNIITVEHDNILSLFHVTHHCLVQPIVYNSLDDIDRQYE